MAERIKTTRELQELVKQYQSGTHDNAVDTMNIEQQKNNEPSYYKIATRKINSGFAETYTQEALDKGYGTSKYDKEFTPGEDIENHRAIEQSNLAKITNYAGKGAITAATTFADGTVGLIGGLLYGAYEAIADPDNDGRHVIDAMVNNPFTNSFEKLREWSDKALPTYLTQEQRTEEYQKEWYNHIFTTDFVGEFIQNFGFTIGAMYSGALWSKGFTAATRKLFTNNVLKSAIVAAEGDAKATDELKRAYDALQKGNLTKIDATKLSNNLQDVAKSINKQAVTTQLFGATVGALAEGGIEGVSARKEFMDELDRKLFDEHDEQYAQAVDDVLGSGNRDWVTKSSKFDFNTMQFTPALTKAGEEEILRRQREITAKQREQLEIANREGDRMATLTLALNIPVLTSSNMVQFSRMLSGGWNTSRKLASVRGGIKNLSGVLTGNFKQKGTVATKTVLKSLENVLSESSEEMLQGMISSGNNEYAMAKVAEFNNDAYDEDSINSVRYYLENFGGGAADYIKDIKNWKEGAMGGLTGLFGIPGRQWNGGIAEAYKEAKSEIDASRDAAERLNAVVNKPDFRSRWNGYIRHLKYDNEMDTSLANDDKYAWKTADDKQLISDVVAFAEADRLDDLIDIAESFKEVSASDIENLKTNLDWAKGLSNEQITDKISKQADRLIETARNYRDIYESMMSRAPIGASPAFIQELVTTSQMIQAYETRFSDMLNEVIKAVDPILLADSQKTKNKYEQKKKLDELRNFFNSAMDAFPINVMPDAIVKQVDEDLKTFAESTSFDDNLKKKIKDMRKIINDRQSFYHKLQFLQGEAKNEDTGKNIPAEDAQKVFEKAAITPGKVEKASADVNATEETDGLKTVDDVRTYYISGKTVEDRNERLGNLNKAATRNPNVKAFIEMKKFFDKFQSHLETVTSSEDAMTKLRLISLLNSMFRKAKSMDEMKSMTDDLFDSHEVFNSKFGSVFNGISLAKYEQYKTILRDAMKSFLNSSTRTQATASAPIDIKPDSGHTASGSGYDGTPDASSTGTPQPKEEKPKVKLTEVYKDYIKGAHSKWTHGLREKYRTSLGDEFDTIDTIIEEAYNLIQNNKFDYDIFVAYNDALKSIPELDFKFDVDALYYELKDTLPEPKQEEKDKYVEQPELTEEEQEKINFDNQKSEDEQIKQEIANSKSNEGKLTYYRTSVPEIDSEENTKAREAISRGDIDAYKSADLSDFVVKHPEYADIWNALHDRGAFEYVATELKPGDKIEFIIDPTFPKYKGEATILMATNVDGKYQVLSVLTSKGDRYYGVDTLRRKIMDEYNEFKKSHQNELFTFSKKSSVFAIMPGVIQYKFGTDENVSINEIPGYSDDAYIVANIKTGETKENGKTKAIFNPVGIRGGEKAVEAFTSLKFHSTDAYGVYYIVKIGGRYIPIRLTTERFNRENYNSDSSIFIAIRDSIRKLSEVLADVTADNIDEQNKKMREVLEVLCHQLDISAAYFKIRPTVKGVQLSISPKAFGPNKVRNGKLIWIPIETESADSIYNRLLKTIASMDRHINVSGQTEEGLQKMIEDGIFKTNAVMLRPKGVDFLCDPWVDTKGEFTKPESDNLSQEYVDELKNTQAVELKDTDIAGVDSKKFDGVDEGDIIPDAGIDNSSNDTIDPSANEVKNEQTKDEVMDKLGEFSVSELVVKDYKDLPEEIQDLLLDRGLDSEDWESYNDEMRERILKC